MRINKDAYVHFVMTRYFFLRAQVCDCTLAYNIRYIHAFICVYSCEYVHPRMQSQRAYAVTRAGIIRNKSARKCAYA